MFFSEFKTFILFPLFYIDQAVTVYVVLFQIIGSEAVKKQLVEGIYFVFQHRAVFIGVNQNDREILRAEFADKLAAHSAGSAKVAAL